MTSDEDELPIDISVPKDDYKNIVAIVNRYRMLSGVDSGKRCKVYTIDSWVDLETTLMFIHAYCYQIDFAALLAADSPVFRDTLNMMYNELQRENFYLPDCSQFVRWHNPLRERPVRKVFVPATVTAE